MLKRVFVFILLNASCLLYGQQLTRFAVVDLSKIYIAYFNDSRAVRDFEERSARVQSEIDRRTKEIQEIRARQAEAVMQNNQSEATRLETQLYRLTQAVNDYYQAQTAILEDQKKRLMQPGSFMNQVHDEIRYIAESEGYSMVLSMNDNTGIVWFSSTVDITDRVIQSLRTRSGR